MVWRLGASSCSPRHHLSDAANWGRSIALEMEKASDRRACRAKPENRARTNERHSRSYELVAQEWRLPLR
jgi:hypothetical protein